GLVVVDVDYPELVDEKAPWLWAELFSTASQTTRDNEPRRVHAFFDAGEMAYSNSTGAFKGIGVDIRGGGYVVLAPSEHPKKAEGGKYTIRGGYIAPLPDRLKWGLRLVGDYSEAVSSEELVAFCERHDTGDNLALLDGHLDRFEQLITNGESRHTSMVKTAAHALTDAARGFYPAGVAMERLHDALEAALPDRNASAEFLSIAQWAVANVKEDPREEGARPRPSVDISNVYSAMPDLAAALNR